MTKMVTMYEYWIVRSYVTEKNRFIMQEGGVPFYYGVEDGKPFVLCAIRATVQSSEQTPKEAEG